MKRWPVARGLSVLGVLSMLGACSTISSTYLGTPKEGKETTGLPIVVERPRYLRVTIASVTKQLVLEKSAAPAPATASGAAPGMLPLPADAQSSGSLTSLVAVGDPQVSQDVSYEIVSVGEVYAIDFKRPAAGTGEFAFEFEPGKQYPKKLTGKVEDKTIKELAEAIGTIAEKVVGLKPTSGQAPMPGVTVIELGRSVEQVLLYDLDQLWNPKYQPLVVYPRGGKETADGKGQ